MFPLSLETPPQNQNGHVSAQSSGQKNESTKRHPSSSRATRWRRCSISCSGSCEKRPPRSALLSSSLFVISLLKTWCHPPLLLLLPHLGLIGPPVDRLKRVSTAWKICPTSASGSRPHLHGSLLQLLDVHRQALVQALLDIVAPRTNDFKFISPCSPR